MSIEVKLQPKHWQALKLIEEQNLTIKDIALQCGIGLDIMYDLYEGNSEKLGTLAHIFKAELQKIAHRQSKKISELLKDSKILALYKINEYLKEKKSLKANKPLVHECTRILNSLAKSTPSVQIDSFSYTQGLTAEDLVNEFTRLGAIAKNALVREGIQSAKPNGSGDLPDSPGRGDQIPKE